MNMFKEFLNKILIFYLPVKADYWNSISRCNIKSKPSEVGDYYLDFLSKAFYPDEFDINNVPLYKYKGNLIYHPIVISQYALGLFEQIKSDKKSIDKFVIQADWLVNNGVVIDKGIYWYINIPIYEYEINKSWISAMAQGEAISVLTRAYSLTQNKKYLLTAGSALVPFTNDVSNNGVVNQFKNIKIFEEYPSKKPSVVLNGFIFSLFGLYDLMLLNIDEAKELFCQGIRSVTKLLPYFDINYWTNYDLYEGSPNNPASYTYHMIHVEQLKTLYILTGDEMFLKYAGKWEAYSKNFCFKSKALIKKIVNKNYKFYD